MDGVSGNLIFHAKKITQKELGKEGYENMLDMMRPENKEIFVTPMLSDEMYPLGAFEDFLHQIAKTQGETTLKRFVYLSTQSQFKLYFGVSKMVPNMFIEKMVYRLWRKQLTTGEVKEAHVENGKVLIRIEGFGVSAFFQKCTMWWFENLFSMLLNTPLKGTVTVKGKMTEFLFT